MTGSTWMLYGANGYSGQLIAEEAVRRGEKPILAGRRADAIAALATKLGLEQRVFGLGGLDGDVARNLDGVKAVLHAAGPFAATSAPMVSACLAAGVHYLDITGEISVFEACHARDAEARARGVVILPGVGFDVVPSDCLAALLARELPGADRLDMAIKFSGGASGGTARSALEGAANGGMIRERGELVRVPAAHKIMEVPFRDRTRTCVSVPWGDVSTAYRSTKIPNITLYMAVSKGALWGMRLSRPFMGALRYEPVKKVARMFLPKSGEGPSEAHRKSARSLFWARVTDASGASRSASLETPEGYELTARTAVESVRRIVTGSLSGSTTPSLAFGADYIKDFADCTFVLD